MHYNLLSLQNEESWRNFVCDSVHPYQELYLEDCLNTKVQFSKGILQGKHFSKDQGFSFRRLTPNREFVSCCQGQPTIEHIKELSKNLESSLIPSNKQESELRERLDQWH